MTNETYSEAGTASVGHVTTAVTASHALQQLDASVGAGEVHGRSWATGFQPLDSHLGGGMHAGDLVLMAGPQGTGKTTVALQMARNVVAAGGAATYVCFEHTPAQLVERLVVMESALAAGDLAPLQEEVRQRLAKGAPDLSTALADLPGASQALRAIEHYGTRLQLVGARGDLTGLDDIGTIAASAPPGLLVVDYLQKVFAGPGLDEDAQVSRTATYLKHLALELGCPVLAITAVERAGLDAPRVRARHVKGSVTLAYEADIILVLQDKYDVVDRRHLVYDVAAGRDHRRWLVCSIEKNRHGKDHLDLEFRKRLAHGHVQPFGRVVEEDLVDERITPGAV
jgi:replicative DNA helicase